MRGVTTDSHWSLFVSGMGSPIVFIKHMQCINFKVIAANTYCLLLVSSG